MAARRVGALAAALVLATGGCSNPSTDVPAAGAETQGQPDPDGGGRRGEESAPTPGGSRNEASKGPSGTGSSAGKGSGTTADSGAGTTKQRSARPGHSVAHDPSGDLEQSGHPPGYIDIRSASIEDNERAARLELLVSTSVPDRTEDRNSTVIVEFRLQAKGRERSISAAADEDGWRPAMDGERYKGTFELRKQSIIFTVPWSVIAFRHGFRWTAHTSWTRNTLLETQYGFDTAPNGRPMRHRP